MKIVNEKDFESEIKEGRVLVDFFASWCMPCKMMGGILEDMEDSLAQDVKIIKIDVDESENLARRFGVLSIPTLVFFKDGEMKSKHVGVMQEEEVKAQLDNL